MYIFLLWREANEEKVIKLNNTIREITVRRACYMKKKFRNPVYHNLKMNQVFPQGWMRRQLEIQAEGLCGNLDLFWADIKDSK